MSVGAVNKSTGDRIPTAGMPAIDDALSLSSTNPVQNAIITAALADKQDATDNNLQTTDKTVVGAINEHEGDISSLMSGLTNKQDKTDNTLTTTAKTVVGAINELDNDVNQFTRAFDSDDSHWYRIANYSVAQANWVQRLFIIAFNGSSIKSVVIRCTPTDGFDNDENKIDQIVGTTRRLALKVSDDKLSISVYIKNGLSGPTTYTILSEMGESSRINFIDPVQTNLTTEEMDVVN